MSETMPQPDLAISVGADDLAFLERRTQDWPWIDYNVRFVNPHSDVLDRLRLIWYSNGKATLRESIIKKEPAPCIRSLTTKKRVQADTLIIGWDPDTAIMRIKWGSARQPWHIRAADAVMRFM